MRSAAGRQLATYNFERTPCLGQKVDLARYREPPRVSNPCLRDALIGWRPVTGAVVGLRLGRVEQWVGAGLVVEAWIESVDPMALDEGREHRHQACDRHAMRMRAMIGARAVLVLGAVKVRLGTAPERVLVPVLAILSRSVRRGLDAAFVVDRTITRQSDGGFKRAEPDPEQRGRGHVAPYV